MKTSTRPATQADYEQLCIVLDQGDTHHREALPQIFRAPDGPARSRKYINDILADENAALYVAEHQERIIGAVHVVMREPPDIPILVHRRYAVIDNIIVAQDHRRAGVGRALMEEAHRWARDKGACEIQLNVWEFNQGAIDFYERLGYRTASRRMWLYLPGPKKE